MTLRWLLGLALLALPTSHWQARAEVSEVTVARLYGIAFLHVTMLDELKLIEKHAKALGLPDLKVTFQQLASTGALTDALLSGTLHVASGGVPGLLLLWDKTNGGMRGFGALNALNQYLLTNNPNIKSVRDLTDKDRIALPVVKISGQAMALQMAAAREYGDSEYTRFDHLTISRAHPDAIVQLLSRKSEITAYFSAPPFQERALRDAGITKVMTVYDVMGPNTASIVYTTARFAQENPTVARAITNAMIEATEILKTDKKAMAELYLKVNKGSETAEQIIALLESPETVITMVPQGVLKYADFMRKIGLIKTKPATVQELFLPFPGLENGS